MVVMVKVVAVMVYSEGGVVVVVMEVVPWRQRRGVMEVVLAALTFCV